MIVMYEVLFYLIYMYTRNIKIKFKAAFHCLVITDANSQVYSLPKIFKQKEFPPP